MAKIFYGRPVDEESPEQTQKLITEEDVRKANDILQKYKQGKANLENRIVQDELWWELRHWESIRGVEGTAPTSAWLFNTIVSKHADAMDNIPEPVVLPREKTDEESAKMLSSVLPVIMEYNDFENVYSENWWEKLKHGTSVYGVTWNPKKENGLGDIDIHSIDLLNIFYEPGIRDIQNSRNLFITDLVDRDLLEEQYPEYKGKFNGSTFNVTEYVYDDTVDTTDKCVVVDWYYKVERNSVTMVHYCRFCNDVILYASENDPMTRDVGYYKHGMYPVVLDVLFPEKSTPIGFGFVSVCKDPQLYIDKLSGNILEASTMGTKKRFFVSNSTGVNEDEFADFSNSIVHVEGEISDARIKEIEITPPSPIYSNIIDQKINEMKETSFNRDVNNGSNGQATAAAAISALQEAGNKQSRDQINSSYRAYQQIAIMCVELIRQFYDFQRGFRIVGDTPGEFEYQQVSNLYIKDQVTGQNELGEYLYRKPVFDLKVKAQKKNPFSKMEMNERAKELYQLGFFNPQNAQQSLLCLNMMDFEGIDKIKEQVSQGATLLNMVQELSMKLQQAEMVISNLTGVKVPQPQGQAPQQRQGNAEVKGSDSIDSKVMDAQSPRTSYQERLAKRSAPDVSMGSPE